MSASTREVLVIGGGHNGLVAALRLARAGCDVTVLEQGAEPGGCVWTEQHPSGVLVERGAFEHGGVLPVAEELGLTSDELGDATLRYREHPVAAGFVFGDGQRRTFHTDLDRTVDGLGDDGAAYRELVALADTLFGMLDTFDVAPTPTQVAAALAPMRGGDELFRTMLLPAEQVIEQSLRDPHTRAALVLQAAHAQVPAWAPGTGLFALLLPASHAGPAVRPVGGSRALTRALVAALRRAGGQVRTDAAVVALRTSSDTRRADLAHAATTPPARVRTATAGVFGGSPGARVAVPSASVGFGWSTRGEVELSDGSVVAADAVVSSIGAPRTVSLLADPAPALRASAAGLHSGHFNVSELTVTVVFDRAVDLGLPDRDAIWYAVADPEDVRRGFAEVLAGQLPSSPWAMVGQVTQPDGVEGSAVWMSSIVPLRAADGAWTAASESAAAQRVVDLVGEVFGVDLRSGLVDTIVSGPSTWERRIGGDGNPNHIDNTIDQLLGWRTPGHADMRTELDWLYLAGAGQHPGGGLSGASGSAAAAAVLTPRAGGRSRLDRWRDEVVGLARGAVAYRRMRRGSTPAGPGTAGTTGGGAT